MPLSFAASMASLDRVVLIHEELRLILRGCGNNFKGYDPRNRLITNIKFRKFNSVEFMVVSAIQPSIASDFRDTIEANHQLKNLNAL